MGLLVGGAVLALYLLTLCPTVYVGDSGELTTAAAVLGVAHPPGYPLYVLLGRLFALLPAGSVAFRVNLLSAVSGAAAASLLFLFARAFLRERERDGAGLPQIAAALTLAAFFAFSRSVWGESVKAEVYTLNLFWISLLLFLTTRRVPSALLFFLLGVAAANHQTALLFIPGMISLLGARGVRGMHAVRTYAIGAAAFLGGATLYLVPLVRPDAPGLFAWRKPSDLAALLGHVFRAQYGGLSEAPRTIPHMLDQGLFLLRFLAREMTLPAVLLPFGLYGALRRRSAPAHRALAIHFLVFSLGLVVLLNHGTDPRDASVASVFYLPAVLFGLLVTAPLLAEAARRMDRAVPRLSLALLVLPILPLAANREVCDARGFTLARDAGEAMLEAAERDAVILTEGDNDTFILCYLQVVEGMRPDVELLDRDLNLFTERYGKEGGGRVLAPERDEAIERLAASDERPIYAVSRYTEEPVGGKRLVSVGPLYRLLSPEGEVAPRSLDRAHPEGLRVPGARDDYMARRFAVSYLFRWIDHYRATGNQDGLAELNHLVRAAGEGLREAHLALGEGAAATGDTAGAVRELERSMAADPEFIEARRRLAELLRADGNLERAEEEYRLVAERTGDPGDLLNLANILLLEGERVEAERAYREAFRTASGDTLVLSGVSRGFGRLGLLADHAEALEALRAGAPGRPEVLESLGDAYDLLGRGEEALAAYREAAGLDAENPRLAYKLGLLSLRTGRDADARRELGRAIEADSAFADALNALAFSYGESGERLAEALSLADRALRHGERSQIGYYQDTRGRILARLGRAAEAEEAFRRSLDTTPAADLSSLAETCDELARVREARGDAGEARSLRARADSLRAAIR
ncbi:MAG: DUF2723 domain-containing protein [Candidatus Eisenbacteria bacterium]